MNPRIALYGLAHRHRLDARDTRALLHAAGLDDEPAGLAQRLWPAIAVLAAALGGLGVILWLAANWDTLGRFGRFALLQGAVLLCCVGAAARPGWRQPFGLLALLCTGGLLAYFGQTYQTGADPWQLFALWAALTLPLCLAVRSDVLWAPWALLTLTGVSLWTQAHTGHRWRVRPEDLGTFAIAWALSALLVAALGPLGRRVTGAGVWAQRVAATLAVIGITLGGLGALFHSEVAAHYPLAVILFALAAFVLARPPSFDVFVLSAFTLGLNTLLAAGLARWLFEHGRGDTTGTLLVIGLVAAGLLAASVSLVTRLARRGRGGEEARA